MLNDDQVNAMQELQRHGKSKRALAKIFGVGRAPVDRYLDRINCVWCFWRACATEALSNMAQATLLFPEVRPQPPEAHFLLKS